MDKNSNNMLIIGVGLLVAGLFLSAYSISSYIETKTLTSKIDFEELENNNQMPDSEKYYQYLSNSDFLNSKLNQNKDFIVKNASCAYVDFAYHNAVSFYKLTQGQSDMSKQGVAQGNIRSLIAIMDSYKSCKNTSQYKSELQKILDSEDKMSDLYEREQMDNFINGDYINEFINVPQETEQESEPVIIEEPITYPKPNASDTMQTGGTY